MYFRGDKNVFRVILLAPQVLGALIIAEINLKLMLQNSPFCLTFRKILSDIDFSDFFKTLPQSSNFEETMPIPIYVHKGKYLSLIFKQVRTICLNCFCNQSSPRGF